MSNNLLKSYCLILACSYLCQITLPAQSFEENFNCAYDEVQQSLLATPEFKEKEEEYTKEYVRYIRSNSQQERAGILYTLPTVVHIIHAGAALGSEANPTNDEIQTILQQSSDRFRHTSAATFTNSYSGRDAEIEFCLATTGPDGNYTTGVLRHYEPTLSVGPYNMLSSFITNTQWDKSKYNNMYIMTNMTNAAGVYLGSSDVTVYDAGTFWSGLIAHEIGHYLSLAHTFNDGCTNNNCLEDGDGVCDTPPKENSGTQGNDCDAPGNSCSTDDDDLDIRNPYRPTANGGIGDQADLLENYMDYTGGCWAAFTEGQVARMRFNIENNRMSLVNNTDVCASRAIPPNEIGVIDFNITTQPCSPIATLSNFTVKNYGTALLTSFKLEILVNGTLISTQDHDSNIPVGAEVLINISNAITLNEGTNQIVLRTKLPNGQADGFSNNDSIIQNHYYSAQGIVPPYQEAFTETNWAEGYKITNASNVQWTIGQSSTSRIPCFESHFAFVQAFSNTSQIATIQLPLVNLSGLADAALSFKYGYVQRYENILDTLLIKVSSDCTTPQMIWSKAGTDLSTGGFSDGARVFPNCDHDEEVSIDLSAFAGQEKVTIEFIAAGQFYSGLVLDSIAISSNTATCSAPSNLSNQEITDNSASIQWDTTTTASNYQLQYREIGTNSWQTINTINTSSYTINSLSPSKSYEWQIRAQCSNNLNSDWVGSGFTTPATYCPDLIVTDLQVTGFTANSINYSYTIKNIGTAPANLDGPTSSQPDNVSIQAFISSDMIFNNSGDLAAGGSILGLSPLGNLAVGASRSGTFGAGRTFSTSTHPYLTLKVDWGSSLDECNENNNTFATLIEQTHSSADFLGHWQHEDINTSGIPVMIIREANSELLIHGFGKCSPTYCDWGEATTMTTDAQDGEITTIWDQGFVIQYDTITLINETTLSRTIFSTYTDNSGRSDRTETFLMHRNDCVNHLDIFHLTGDNATYWSANDLTTNGSVSANQVITLKGGNSVLLRPGFHAKSGSTFTAMIESCMLSTITPASTKVAENRTLISTTVAENINATQIQVHPNPLQNQATIRFYVPVATSVKLGIVNLNGQVVAAQAVESVKGWQTTQLDASELPAGMYYITLQTEEGRWTEKVMVVE